MISKSTWIKKLERICLKRLPKHPKIFMNINKEHKYCCNKVKQPMKIRSLCKTRLFKWELIKMKTLHKHKLSLEEIYLYLINKMLRNKLLEKNYMLCKQNLEICKSIMNLEMLRMLTYKMFYNLKKN